jgi:hypothetical protein
MPAFNPAPTWLKRQLKSLGMEVAWLTGTPRATIRRLCIAITKAARLMLALMRSYLTLRSVVPGQTPFNLRQNFFLKRRYLPSLFSIPFGNLPQRHLFFPHPIRHHDPVPFPLIPACCFKGPALTLSLGAVFCCAEIMVLLLEDICHET